MSERVLDVDDVEATHVTLPRGDDTHTAQIVATGDHAQRAGLELDVVDDLAALDVVADRVVHLHQRIRVADGATIVRHQVWNSLRAGGHLLHLAQLVLFLQRKCKC